MDALASRLGATTYRFRDGQWECRDDGEWVASSVLDGHSYDEGVGAVATCPWASLAEEEEVAPPVDEYERLHRQKVAILAAQESEEVRLLKRKLVDASETIAFWKQHAHRLAHEKGVLRADVEAAKAVIRVVREASGSWQDVVNATTVTTDDLPSVAISGERQRAHERRVLS